MAAIAALLNDSFANGHWKPGGADINRRACDSNINSIDQGKRSSARHTDFVTGEVVRLVGLCFNGARKFNEKIGVTRVAQFSMGLW